MEQSVVIAEEDRTGNPFAANTTHALRGNYGGASEDFTIDQNHAAYSEEEHARWRRLYQRQMSIMPGRAAQEFLDGLDALGASDGIPDLGVGAPGPQEGPVGGLPRQAQ